MKEKSMKILKDFLLSLLAGFCIGLGATAYLAVKDTAGIVVGSLLFCVGLFVVCTRGYNLFTGKVCYIFDNKLPNYLLFLLIVWIGNLMGAMLLAVIFRFSGVNAVIQPVAKKMVDAKLASSYLSLFLLGIVCDIFIFIGVNGYAKIPHEVGKYLAIILGVMCFICAGTEHSVADMYYFAISGVLYTNFGKTILCLLVVSLGNIVGGVFFPLLEKFIKWEPKKEEKEEIK